MTMTKAARLAAASRVGLRSGVEHLRLSRLAKPLTQAEIMAVVVPDSDLDVLVVVADGVDQNQASKDLYRCFRGLGFAVDALVVGESDLALHGDDPWLVYRSALSEGKELFHAQAQAPA